MFDPHYGCSKIVAQHLSSRWCTITFLHMICAMLAHLAPEGDYAVLTEEEWKALLGAVTPKVVTAHTYRGIRFGSFSSPVVLGCDDGEDYVVKAPNADSMCRAICNDQIVGRIANAMHAPVPPIALVEIPADLIAGEPALRGTVAGFAHGSRYMPNASKDRMGIQHENLPENRRRFSALAILYGIPGAYTDHQFFYEDVTNHVYSFDHGHFFPGGPDWTIASLNGQTDVAPDQVIVSSCRLVENELCASASDLAHVTKTAIATAVAYVHANWKLTEVERVALTQFLLDRRDRLAEMHEG